MPDELTREEMILQWLPLALKMAYRYKNTGILKEDRQQEATLGLIIAVDGFNSEKGSFKPYACRVMANRLMNMCAEQMKPYRVPVWLNRAAIKVSHGQLEGISPYGLAAVRFLKGYRVGIDHDITMRSPGRTP